MHHVMTYVCVLLMRYTLPGRLGVRKSNSILQNVCSVLRNAVVTDVFRHLYTYDPKHFLINEQSTS